VDDILKYNRVSKALKQQFGTVTHEQLCQVLGWPRKRLESAIHAGGLGASMPRSLDLSLGGDQDSGDGTAYDSISEDDLLAAEGTSMGLTGTGVRDPGLQELQLLELGQTLGGVYSRVSQELQQHSSASSSSISSSSSALPQPKSKAAKALLEVMADVEHPGRSGVAIRCSIPVDLQEPGCQDAAGVTSSSSSNRDRSSKGTKALESRRFSKGKDHVAAAAPATSNTPDGTTESKSKYRMNVRIDAHLEKFVGDHRSQLEMLLQESQEASGGRMALRSAAGAYKKSH
jgi:hypothetical protein